MPQTFVLLRGGVRFKDWDPPIRQQGPKKPKNSAPKTARKSLPHNLRLSGNILSWPYSLKKSIMNFSTSAIRNLVIFRIHASMMICNRWGKSFRINRHDNLRCSNSSGKRNFAMSTHTSNVSPFPRLNKRFLVGTLSTNAVILNVDPWLPLEYVEPRGGLEPVGDCCTSDPRELGREEGMGGADG